MCVYKYHCMSAKVGGQIYGVSSPLFPLPGSWELNLGHQTCLASAFTH